MVKNDILNIWMNGYLVGKLSNKKGKLAFGYSPAWLNTDGARPLSLSMPLREASYDGDIAYNYFDNLLPNSRPIRQRIQAKFSVDTSHPFDLLAAIGADCVGAIQVLPPEHPAGNGNVQGTALSARKIASILNSYQANPLGMVEADDEDFRISIAGAQEKTALLYYNKKWMRPLGSTATTHILKLPIGRIEGQGIDLSESCENEWLCLQIAKAFGLDVCQARLQSFAGTKVLVVERFDRLFDQERLLRLPMEDMCQVHGISPNLKYENDGGIGIARIMNTLLQSKRAEIDRDGFFKSQILFWLLAAPDGHAKNFSIFLKPFGRYQLTPLYDIMSAYPLMACGDLQAQKLKLSMALIGKNRHYKWHSMQPRHFISTAKAVNYSPQKAAQLLEEMLDRVDEVIDKVCANLPKKIPEHIAGPIFEGMRTRAGV